MIEGLVKYLFNAIFKLSQNTQFSCALEFFILNTIKILLVLPALSFAASFTRSCFTVEKKRKVLPHKKKFIGNILITLGQNFIRTRPVVNIPGIIIIEWNRAGR